MCSPGLPVLSCVLLGMEFLPIGLELLKKHRTKADLKSDPQRSKWQAHSLLFMYGSQRTLEMVGIFC